MSKILEELREIVLEETKNRHSNYRCHEVARLVRNKLKLLGMNVKVKDGVVGYDVFSLVEEHIKDFFEDEEEIPEKIPREKTERKLWLFHSWCEVIDSQGDLIVIDWHNSLELSRELTLGEVLIVEYKKNLLHNYYRGGITIGKWIISTVKIPPYFTKLRI